MYATENNLGMILKTAAFALVNVLFIAILDYRSDSLNFKFIGNVIQETKSRLAAKIISKDFEAYNQQDASAWMAKIETDTEIVRYKVIGKITNIVFMVVKFAVTLILLFSFNVWLGILAIIYSIISLKLPDLFMSKLSVLMKNQAEAKQASLLTSKQLTDGYLTISTANAADYFSQASRETYTKTEQIIAHANQYLAKFQQTIVHSGCLFRFLSIR